MKSMFIHSAAFVAKVVIAGAVIIDAAKRQESPEFRGKFWIVDAAKRAWLKDVRRGT